QLYHEQPRRQGAAGEQPAQARRRRRGLAELAQRDVGEQPLVIAVVGGGAEDGGAIAEALRGEAARGGQAHGGGAVGQQRQQRRPLAVAHFYGQAPRLGLFGVQAVAQDVALAGPGLTEAEQHTAGDDALGFAAAVGALPQLAEHLLDRRA